MGEHLKIRPAIRGIVPLVIAALLSGCATAPGPAPRATYHSSIHPQDVEPAQGGSWEAVFASPDVARALEFRPAESSPEFSRADHRMGSAQVGPMLATSDWPEPRRDSLDRRRIVDVRDRDGRIVYFGPERRYQRRHDWWDWQR